jgi:hypothetical protein
MKLMPNGWTIGRVGYFGVGWLPPTRLSSWNRS